MKWQWFRWLIQVSQVLRSFECFGRFILLIFRYFEGAVNTFLRTPFWTFLVFATWKIRKIKKLNWSWTKVTVKRTINSKINCSSSFSICTEDQRLCYLFIYKKNEVLALVGNPLLMDASCVLFTFLRFYFNSEGERQITEKLYYNLLTRKKRVNVRAWWIDGEEECASESEERERKSDIIDERVEFFSFSPFGAAQRSHHGRFTFLCVVGRSSWRLQWRTVSRSVPS